jgi:glycosyltransferase involved in cell wall biosynthesis
MQSVNKRPGAHALSVLFVATSDGEGGIERYSVRLASLLRARGVQVIYACRPGGFLARKCATQGIPTAPWHVRNSGDLRSSLTLARLVRRLGVNIVHVHSRRDYVPAIVGAQLARHVQVILHAHLVRPLGEPPRLAGRFFCWGADRVIAVSEAVRLRLRQVHGFTPEFVPLLPNGVDVSAYEFCDGAAQRQAWGIPADALVIGMIGRLNAKGQERLLQAGPELMQTTPKLWFVLAGPVGDAHDRERLLAQAQELGIADRVALPGMIEDVPNAMAAFDILVHLPSDESFGLALAEAMAAGLPTVASDVGGCREVVQDGVTGFLVPLDDVHVLHSSLMRMLDPNTGPALRARMGAAGRQRVLDEFALNRQVERLHDLYQHLIWQATPRASVLARRMRLRVAPLIAAFALTGTTLSLLAHLHPLHHVIPRNPIHDRLALGPYPHSHVPRR